MDLWWQPAGDIGAAQTQCLATPPCSGVYWNDVDNVYKMLSGAVQSTPAPASLQSTHSLHTHACNVDDFRARLQASGHSVVFVVTTVPRGGVARNRDGTSYFSTHLDSVLKENIPVIFVQGQPTAGAYTCPLFQLCINTFCGIRWVASVCQ
jgi:hypothetical protein